MIDWKKENEAAKKVVFYPNDVKYLRSGYNSNLGVVIVAAITAFIILKAFK